MLRNKTQTCWIYSLYRPWKIASGPVLIPGPIGARCVTVDHLQLDQGSVERVRDCTGSGPLVKKN